jgi:hypothetical protein
MYCQTTPRLDFEDGHRRQSGGYDYLLERP